MRVIQLHEFINLLANYRSIMRCLYLVCNRDHVRSGAQPMKIPSLCAISVASMWAYELWLWAWNVAIV